MTGAAEQRDIPVGDGALRVATSGAAGKPWLTCLHTLATDMRLWNGQLPALEREFRVLRIDMSGHGGSTITHVEPTIATLADDVIAVWDALGIARSALLGLSIGGMISLELALRVPARVERALVCGCRADAPDAFRAMWQGRRAILDRQGVDGLVEPTMQSWFGERRDTDLSPVRAMIAGTSADGYRGATIALEGLSLAPRLGAIAVPVRYVVGSEDGVHPDAMTAMAAATSGADFVIIPGAGHLPNIEKPDAFAAATLGFLRGDDLTPRIGPPDPATMTARQREVHDAIASGPRGRVEGPLGVWLNSAELADAAQRLGAFCRYGSALPPRLSELAIITVGAFWRAGFEWHIHAPIAREAGIDPAAIEAIRTGGDPVFEKDDERAVHRFTRELLETRVVSDEGYALAEAALGPTGVVDLVGIIGYYGFISATINAFRVPVPGGSPLPFGDLA